MKTTFPVESHVSPAPGIIPEPSIVHGDHTTSTSTGSPQALGTRSPSRLAGRRTPFARLMAALRGDKYMVDAYPPDESPTKRA